MRGNMLFLSITIASLAMISGCSKPSSQSGNASADAGQFTAATETTSNSDTQSDQTSRRASVGRRGEDRVASPGLAARERAEYITKKNAALTGVTSEVSDIGFATSAAMDDTYAIAASRMALERSQSERVKRFAQETIDSHRKELFALRGAVPPNISMSLPTDLDIQHAKMLEDLKRATDEDFDNLYLAQQWDTLQAAEGRLKNYVQYGDEAMLKRFVQDSLPTIERHLDRLADLTSHKQLASYSPKRTRTHD